MVRYDLAFFLCCCNAFLRSDRGGEDDDYYHLLDIDRDASPDDIKRAYKKASLKMHPDKLAQRGQAVTAGDQEKFTKMKEAYEILSDPHKRETYNAIGAKGLKWTEEPYSIDPQEIAHNFATSSVVDRSKIFAIFVAVAIAIFLQPLLICLMADGIFGAKANWFAVFTPLWLWDAFILFYHIRVILMGPIPKPDNIPDEEWVDPLPMRRRYFSLVRFILVLDCEILIAMKLQKLIMWQWNLVFLPIYLTEISTLLVKLPHARMQIVTMEELETTIMGKPFAEFTPEEKASIANKYTVVPCQNSPHYAAAYQAKHRAKQEVLRLILRLVFLVFFCLQLDLGLGLSWWFVFLPVWAAIFSVCYYSFLNFVKIQAVAKQKDPEFFGGKSGNNNTQQDGTEAGTDVENQANYGAMKDGDGLDEKPEPIAPEEREVLQTQIATSGQKLVSNCCTQTFVLIILCLLVAKIQNPNVYAAVWILFPMLLIAGIVLCCLGMTIFCVTEIPEYDTAAYVNAMQGGGDADPEGVAVPGEAAAQSADTVYVPPPPPAASNSAENVADNTTNDTLREVPVESSGKDANDQSSADGGASAREQKTIASPSEPVDLLDAAQPSSSSKQMTPPDNGESIHELD